MYVCIYNITWFKILTLENFGESIQNVKTLHPTALMPYVENVMCILLEYLINILPIPIIHYSKREFNHFSLY